MEKQFLLQILTPKQTYINKLVDSIQVFTDTGEVNILPNHVEYLANVTISKLTITCDGNKEIYAVGGGAIHFYEKENMCKLLLRNIFASDEIDIVLAKQSQIEAEEKLKSSLSLVGHNRAERVLKRAINMLDIKNENK